MSGPHGLPWTKRKLRICVRCIHVSERQGRLDEADRFSAWALTMGNDVFDPADPDLSVLVNNRAAVLMAQVRFPPVLLVSFEPLPTGRYNSWWHRPNDCFSNIPQAKFDEADALFLRAIEMAKQSVGVDHRMYATKLYNRACLLNRQVMSNVWNHQVGSYRR